MPARRRTTSSPRTSRPTEILVKVARTGGAVTEVVLEPGAVVEDALEAAEVSRGSNDRIRVNGRVASEDTELSNNDIVTVAGKIEGGK